jgi:uncharacterized membrane protein (UPF0127 family)
MIEAVPMGRPAIALLAGMIALGACSPTASSPDVPEMAFEDASLVIETDSGEVRVRVEIADSPEERARGLMLREELPPDGGMVFLRKEVTPGRFWMKDTLIPLSLAVWGPDGRIRAMLDMEPCRAEPCPLYDPEVSWIGAVEVNQRFLARNGVEVGDRVRLER